MWGGGYPEKRGGLFCGGYLVGCPIRCVYFKVGLKRETSVWGKACNNISLAVTAVDEWMGLMAVLRMLCLDGWMGVMFVLRIALLWTDK